MEMEMEMERGINTFCFLIVDPRVSERVST